ncbi:MAG: hypothetical protein PHH77_10675 [Victivallaceae bacterium]|nr:hypothetical protein [Victivallaceae bacterium]
MQILKVKTIAEFASAEVPAGTLLVFPEQQTDGSYLWRCKDSDGNAGTIGSAGNIASVNGQTGPEIVLEPADLGAVAENLSSEYSRPDSLLAQMMFFIRNGAVNLYGTLGDLKDFMGGYFAAAGHGHAIAEVTDLQTTLDGKLTANFSGIQAIVDGENISYYSNPADLLAYLNTQDTSTTTGVVLNFAPGSYSYEGDLTFPSLRMVLNGNNSDLTVTGNLGFSRNVIIRNFDDISSGGTITFGHASIENAALIGAVSISGGVGTQSVNITGDVTVINATKQLVFSRGTLTGSVSSLGSLILLDAIVQGNSESPLINSTGGSVQVMNSFVVNSGSGGGISCDNGAAASAPNVFANVVISGGTIAAGSAVTFLGPFYAVSTPTGAALIYMSAPGEHNHDIDEITGLQTSLDAKTDLSLLTPTTVIYIDGNRTDEYTEDGSIAYPYKTIAAATAAHQEPVSYFIAKGTYAETAEINLYTDSVVYGAYSSILGLAINIGEGCYVHNLMFYNTVNVAVNGNSPMFHYCRFMGATLNLDGSTDFDGCYISSAATFNVTMAVAYSLRAFNSSIHTAISAACCMYFNDCGFSVSSTGYAVASTGGLLSMVTCLVYNLSTGGGISCNNGANGITTYNFLVSVATNKDIACGTAVSIIGGDVQYASLTGAAIVFPARIQAALDSKQTKAAAYNLGTGLSGAISVDIADGNTQYGTLSGATTLAYGSISNLEEGQNFILQLDNAAGQTFSFTAETAGSIAVLGSGDTGCYKIAFSKVDGKICYDGKNEVIT